VNELEKSVKAVKEVNLEHIEFKKK